MTTTIYKRLFEVRIIHEYFLDDGNLIPALESGRYKVENFLEIAPTPETRELFRNQRMRMVTTPPGFFIGLEVNQEETGDNKFYTPFIRLDDDTPITFYFRIKDELFFNYTNFPLDDHVPAICYFSNKNGRKPGENILISKPPPGKDTNIAYVMGELVKNGSKTEEVIVRRDGSQEFRDLTGDGFVNRSDKYLLPKKFGYNFRQNVSGNAEFKLTENGNAVKTISKSFAGPVRFASLDFEKKDDHVTFIPDGEYDLEVNAGSFSDNRKVLLNNKLYDTGWFGVLVIYPKTGKADCDLLDAAGRLKTRILNGAKQPHPVFELRLLSRKTFWRYQSKNDIEDDEFQPQFLERQAGVKNILYTKEPRAFTKRLSVFGNDVRLPNANAASLRQAGRTYYSDIHVSAINRILKE